MQSSLSTQCANPGCDINIPKPNRGFAAKRCPQHRLEHKRECARNYTSGGICSDAECDRPAHTKGLCRRHYKRTQPRLPDKKVWRSCVVCGTSVLRSPRIGFTIGATCSSECRRLLTYGQRCELPDHHMARWYGQSCEWKPPKTIPARFVSGYCADCNSPFTYAPNGDPGVYCSDSCGARAGRRRRRAREHNAEGSFTFAEVMRQYAKQGNTCAYCKTPCAGLPDPEHVLALSRGGRNDMSNLVAACRQCNTDKNDLTLTEWAEDRARRSLPVVDTTLDGPEFRHLAIRQPDRPAWRYSTAA